MGGFLLLSVVTLCRLPEVWTGDAAPHGHDAPADAAIHQGA
jgi:hypothetical protein